MGQGKDVYEENKRLRAENDLLREQEENARLRREAAAGELADLAMKACTAFLSGTASIMMMPGNQPGFHNIYFQMSPDADQG